MTLRIIYYIWQLVFSLLVRWRQGPATVIAVPTLLMNLIMFELVRGPLWRRDIVGLAAFGWEQRVLHSCSTNKTWNKITFLRKFDDQLIDMILLHLNISINWDWDDFWDIKTLATPVKTITWQYLIQHLAEKCYGYEWEFLTFNIF